MARFTRTQLGLDAKSNETVSRQSREPIQKSLIKLSYRSMSENEELIVRVMETMNYPLSRLQIARFIGRKKAPGLNALIEQMAINGILCKHVVRRANGVEMYLYEIQKWE